MNWAKAALAGGLLLLLAAFAVGTEHELRTSVAGQAQDCGPAISASWLVPGTPDLTQPGSSASDGDRRAAALCGPVVHESRRLIVTLMGVGGLLALAGWTALDTRGRAVRRPLAPAPA